MRLRTILLAGGSALAVAFYWYTDPDGGGLTAMLMGSMTLPIVAVLFAHIARKALFDYLDMGDLYREAKKSAVGSAIIFLGICIVLFGLLGLFGSKTASAETIPSAAFKVLPIVQVEKDRHWPDHPKHLFSQA